MNPPATGPSVIATPTTEPQNAKARVRIGAVELMRQYGKRCAELKGGANALKGTSGIEHQEVHCRSAEKGSETENSQTEHQHLLAAVAVSEGTCR